MLALVVYLISSRQESKKPQPQSSSHSLGTVKDFEGEVFLRAFGETQDGAVSDQSTPLPLTNMLLIKTGDGGHATLDLQSGYELRLAESSQVLIEVWEGKQDTPLYLHLLSGDYEVLRIGERGQVLVLQNREIFFPENKSQASTGYDIYKSITQHRAAGAEDIEDDKADAERPILPRSENMEDTPPTLENEEIDRTLTGYRVHFERCQTNAMRDKAPSLGELLVGIKISPKGNVEEARVISSTLKNPGFENCVLSVFERAKLRAFNGPSITRSYPLIFE